MGVLEYALTQSTRATTLVVPACEVKVQARMSSDCTLPDDVEMSLQNDILSAQELVEQDAELVLQTETWVLKLDGFPLFEDYIFLHKRPVQSITSVVYTDENGTSQTWAASNYNLDANRTWPVLFKADNDVDWPDTDSERNVVTITFVAGYTPATLPRMARRAVKLMAAHSFQNSMPVTFGNVQDMPLTYQHAIEHLKSEVYV